MLQFPARTLEAIKGKRRQAEYRRILEDLRNQRLPLAIPDHLAVASQEEEIRDGPQFRRYELRPRRGLQLAQDEVQVVEREEVIPHLA